MKKLCLICGREISLHKNGRFYRHIAGGWLRCPGSGFHPETLVHAKPVRSA